MSLEQLPFGADARETILPGATAPVDAMRVTLGSKAHCAHGDTTVGELVAASVEKVGAEDVASVEEARGTMKELLPLLEGVAIRVGTGSETEYRA